MKYNNQGIYIDGMHFDSRLEGKRYEVLRDAAKRGEISNLRRQVEYELIPKQTRPVAFRLKTKAKVVDRVVERPCIYRADFVYDKVDFWGIAQTIVEDTKGKSFGRGKHFSTETKDFIIKRKLMLWLYNIRVRIVSKASEEI